MFYLLRLIYEHLKNFDELYRDRRSDDFLLMGNPLKIITLTLVYFTFVKVVGPKLMENRKAFDLKHVMMVYNVVQVIINSYLFSKSLYHLLVDRPYPNITCMVPLMDKSRMGIIEMNLCYLYVVLKVLDFMDTIFFVLRKRYNQVSFLHVYHHVVVCLGSFVFMRYLPGGHGSMLGVLNCLVHVVMYFYYFVTALRPTMKKSLWWKKYITQLQIVQFLVLIVHFTIPLLNPSCGYPAVGLIFAVVQNIMMAIMFTNFYIKAYVAKPKAKSDMELPKVADKVK